MAHRDERGREHLEDRQSRFPRREGGTGPARDPQPDPARGPKRPGRRLPMLLFALATAGALIYLNQQVLNPHGGDIPLFNDENQSVRELIPEAREQAAEPSARASPFTPAAAGAEAGVIPISLSRDLQPVGLQIGARSRSLRLSEMPDSLFRHLPPDTGFPRYYTMLPLRAGQEYRMVLDLVPEAPRLWVDSNRNGDFTDDEGPLRNQGTGPFATRLQLDLAMVTGEREFVGQTYDLWLFVNEQGLQNKRLQLYARTQLRGELNLDGNRYPLWLADNLRLDGDYRNDGVSLDLNGDGRIDAKTEYVPPGGSLRVADKDLNFDIRP